MVCISEANFRNSSTLGEQNRVPIIQKNEQIYKMQQKKQNRM